MSARTILGICWLLALLASSRAAAEDLNPEVLAGTDRLEFQGDVATAMVDGIDLFLLRQTAQSVESRQRLWQPDVTSAEAHAASLTPKRQRLAKILGVRDDRILFDSPTLVSTVDQPGMIGTHERYKIFAIRWPVVRDVTSEGLLILPSAATLKGTVIYLTDADQTPQQACHLSESARERVSNQRSPLDYAEAGYRVIIPRLISRRLVTRNGRVTLSQREYLYRCSYVLGRHIIGYELQKVLACVDWIRREQANEFKKTSVPTPILIDGQGEGGLLAFFAAAIDKRIDIVKIQGAFGSRMSTWKEGIDRNLFGLLSEFGDAELAAMIAPRSLTIAFSGYPEINLSGEAGGAPGKLSEEHVDRAEVGRITELTRALKLPKHWLRVETQPATTFSSLTAPQWHHVIDDLAQEDRLVYEIERDTQWLLAHSAEVRAEFMKGLDTTSPQSYAQSIEAYRKIFRQEVIGEFDIPLKPAHARTRKQADAQRFTSYEVMLDVWDDVFAYGVLLLPKDLKPNERRPVVVCQHGLEGRPNDTILGDHPAYHDFAAKLCERGFIVFAPQNPYIGQHRFRTLQRKANPLGKSLFSIIVPQHQQILNWLKSLPYVDDQQIAFYGLSYGGKSAMRIPPLVTGYCLSICSADFNEWVAKCASTQLPFSYVWTGEYEIFEWDLGSRFNYAEMAALIAPRPFMVERGHTDGVSTDDWVAHEYAKVRYLYNHRLKLGDRCQIEFFDGPHTIHGEGTFKFLHHHLHWPEPATESSESVRDQ